jgi:hypothetical protein
MELHDVALNCRAGYNFVETGRQLINGRDNASRQR